MASANVSSTSNVSIPQPTDSYKTWYQSKIIVLSIFGTVISCLNISILFLFAYNRALRKKIANILLLNQALADLFNGIILIPADILMVYFMTGSLTENGESVLVFSGASNCFSLISSLFSFIATASDRCFSVARPLMHRRVMTRQKLITGLGAVWILAAGLSVIPFTWAHEEKLLARFLYFLYGLVLATFVLVLVLYGVTFFIARSYVSAKKSMIEKRQNSIEKNKTNQMRNLAKKEIRVAKIFAIMFLFFVVAYLPQLVINVLDFLTVPYDQVIVTSMCMYAYLLSSVFNPLLTLTLKQEYSVLARRALSSTMRRQREAYKRKFKKSSSASYEPSEKMIATDVKLTEMDATYTTTM